MTRPLLPVVLILVSPAFIRAAEPPAADVQRSVTRALSFVEARGTEWIEQRGCVTCHQTTFLIWSHVDARRHGIAVDARKLNEWTTWALASVVSASDAGANQGPDTLSQLLLSRELGDKAAWLTKPAKSDRTADPYENVVKRLLVEQSEDGHWDDGGQSKNPGEIGTAWALLGLAARDEWMAGRKPTDPRSTASSTLKKLIKANDDAIPAARQRAQAFLAKIGGGSAQALGLNEWFVVRVLMERRLGTAEHLKERVDALLANQNKDGGWSTQVVDGGAPSDAFATGQSLYALGVAGVPQESKAVRRGVRFLIDTQRDDGGWSLSAGTFHAPTTKPARNASLEAVYAHWGSGWAVLGMVQTLPVDGAARAEAP